MIALSPMSNSMPHSSPIPVNRWFWSAQTEPRGSNGSFPSSIVSAASDFTSQPGSDPHVIEPIHHWSSDEPAMTIPADLSDQSPYGFSHIVFAGPDGLC
jgi:hypothetical protein